MQKKLKFRWKRYFQELVSFDTHSATNLSSLPILKKKIDFESFLFKKTQYSYVLEKSYHFNSESSRYFQFTIERKKRTQLVDDFPAIL